MNRSIHFGAKKLENGDTEILFKRNGIPRRFALCTHDNDAEVILEALEFALDKGGLDWDTSLLFGK